MDDHDWKCFAIGLYRAVLNGCEWFAQRDPSVIIHSSHSIAWVLIRDQDLIDLPYETLAEAKSDAAYFAMQETVMSHP